MFSNPQSLVNRMRKPWLRQVVQPLENGLLPPLCLLCGEAGAPGRDLCAGCAEDLPRNETACPRCALPTADEPAEPCGACRAQPPGFDRAFAPYRYEPPVDYLIHGLKYRHRLSHARLLGELLADALEKRVAPLPDCLVPVPLHPARLRERGFNQALELSRATARRFGLPLRFEDLRRTRPTDPQTGLDARQRRSNLRGAFSAARPFEGARVALTDDVITTASTVEECAKTLRAAGAVEIEVWAVARAIAADV